MANELLQQYPTDITEPAKVLLAKVRGENVPLSRAAHAAWHLQGAALNQLLPDNSVGLTSPRKLDNASKPAEGFDAGCGPDDCGDEGQGDGSDSVGSKNPQTEAQSKTQTAGQKDKPKAATDDADSGAPPVPPGFKSKTVGFKHCPQPQAITPEECEHVLAQCSGERGMRGPLTDALLSKLMAVVTKLLTDWISSKVDI
jgi:hypothetical protein